MLFYIYLHFPFRKSIEIDYWKQKLFEALGANEGAYKRLLKDWFIKKCSREQLEMSVRFMLPAKDVHLHDMYLLAILNKCVPPVSPSPGPSSTSLTAAGGSSKEAEQTEEGISKSCSKEEISTKVTTTTFKSPLPSRMSLNKGGIKEAEATDRGTSEICSTEEMSPKAAEPLFKKPLPVEKPLFKGNRKTVGGNVLTNPKKRKSGPNLNICPEVKSDPKASDDDNLETKKKAESNVKDFEISVDKKDSLKYLVAILRKCIPPASSSPGPSSTPMTEAGGGSNEAESIDEGTSSS